MGILGVKVKILGEQLESKLLKLSDCMNLFSLL